MANTVNVQAYELNADKERVPYGTPKPINERKALDLVARFPKLYKIVSGLPEKVIVPKHETIVKEIEQKKADDSENSQLQTEVAPKKRGRKPKAV